MQTNPRKRKLLYLGILFVLTGIFFLETKTIVLPRIYTINWRIWEGTFDFSPSFWEGREEKEVSFDLDASELRTLRLENSHGAVSIQRSPTDRVLATARITVLALEEEQAKTRVKEVEVTKHVLGNTLLTFALSAPSTSEKEHIFVDYTIFLPKNMDVELELAHGNLFMEDLEGALRATVSHCGSVTLKQMHGPIVLVSRHSTLHLEDVAKKANLDLTHSNVVLAHFEDSLEVFSRHSKGSMRAIKGEVELETHHSTWNIHHLSSPLALTGTHSTLDVTNLEDSLSFDLAFGALNLSAFAKDVVGKVNFTNVQITTHEGMDHRFRMETIRGSFRQDHSFQKEEIKGGERYLGVIGQGRYSVMIEGTSASLRLRK